MDFLINLTKEEKKLASRYANKHAMPLDEAFKRALFEKIEDEYDIAIANEACQEYKKTGESRPIQALWNELDL